LRINVLGEDRLKVVGLLGEWIGTIFVAFYSWVSMLSQVLLHWKINTSMQSIYLHLKDKLSEDKLVFVASSVDCKMTFETALNCGVRGGLVAAAAVFAVSIPFMRMEKEPEGAPEFRRYCRKTRIFHPFVYLASLAYFTVLTIVFRLVDPHGLVPYLDAIYGVIIAGIIGASLVVTCTYRRTRYKFRSIWVEKSYLEMAQHSAMQFFHTTVWVFMTMLGAFGAVAVVQGFLRMPPEISSSPEYGTAMTCWVLLTLIPVLGAGLGIVMPALDRVKLAEDRLAELDFKVSKKANA